MQGHTGQRPGGSGGQSQRAGQMGARAFIVVFAGRNGRGSKQAKQVGQFECFQKVPGCRSLRSLPDTWSWARGIVAWRARAWSRRLLGGIWVVCMWKANSQETPVLALRISSPWGWKSLQGQPRYKNLRNTENSTTWVIYPCFWFPPSFPAILFSGFTLCSKVALQLNYLYADHTLMHCFHKGGEWSGKGVSDRE